MAESKPAGLQRVETEEDLRNLIFHEDMAEIEIPVEALEKLPFTNDHRADSHRLQAVEERIRRYGFDNFDRIVARMGRRGRLSIVNGGHRLTAARNVAKEFWANLTGKKVTTIQMIVFRTINSETLIGVPDGAPEPEVAGETRIADDAE